MNYSKQRGAILSYLKSTKTHPTANDIYTEVKKTDPKLSLGTVYRNLGLLSRNGMILRIDTDHDSVHYDGFTHPHYHFVCEVCGKVLDLEMERINLDKAVEEELDCKVNGHSLLFNGVCKDCKKL